jgi:hypothetical protein
MAKTPDKQPEPETPVQEPVVAVVSESTPKRFSVHLNAQTPLMQNPAIVEASVDHEAWDKFCSLNGISGSIHERTIIEVK